MTTRTFGNTAARVGLCLVCLVFGIMPALGVYALLDALIPTPRNGVMLLVVVVCVYAVGVCAVPLLVSLIDRVEKYHSAQ